jgi:hypothetical protein
MTQIHKKFTDDQVKALIERYLKNEIERHYLQEILGISKTRFFALVKSYRENPETFSIQYIRRITTRAIPRNTEKNIIKELTIEKKLIEDTSVPLRSYNYSYIKDRLEKKYKQKVSLPTIINRAKKNDFYLKKPKRTVHIINGAPTLKRSGILLLLLMTIVDTCFTHNCLRKRPPGPISVRSRQ